MSILILGEKVGIGIGSWYRLHFPNILMFHRTVDEIASLYTSIGKSWLQFPHSVCEFTIQNAPSQMLWRNWHISTVLWRLKTDNNSYKQWGTVRSKIECDRHKCDSLWQTVTHRDPMTESDKEWQRVTRSDRKWQQVTHSDNHESKRVMTGIQDTGIHGYIYTVHTKMSHCANFRFFSVKLCVFFF